MPSLETRRERSLLERARDDPSAREQIEYEEIPSAGLVFRSVGYYGVALPGVPFREDWGVVLQRERARFARTRPDEPESAGSKASTAPAGSSAGLPVSLAPTSRTHSKRYECMLEDVEGRQARFSIPSHLRRRRGARNLVRERKPNYFSYDDWKKLDALEIERKPEATGRLSRVKFTSHRRDAGGASAAVDADTGICSPSQRWSLCCVVLVGIASASCSTRRLKALSPSLWRAR